MYKKSNPDVSWLICSNKNNQYLFDALDSCFAQTFRNFEVVFVANGKDAFKIASEVNEYYKNESRLRVFSTRISGLTFSLSLGLHKARANLIARMDADDISLPERIQKQFDFMTKNPDVSILGSAYSLINFNNKIIKSIYPPTENDVIRKKLIFSNIICHPSVMFRRDVVEKNGGYMGYIYAEDYDLWLNLLFDSSIVFANLNSVELLYRQQSTGVARGSKRSYASAAASQLRNAITVNNPLFFVATIFTTIKAYLFSRRF
jgi:glycosyltransferase involved in cell wall biosynthesis